MKTIEAAVVGADYLLIQQLSALFEVSERTIQRDIQWAVDSELPQFAGYQKGDPLNRFQFAALEVIRFGRSVRHPDYVIAERVAVLSQPKQILASDIETWLRHRLPGGHADRFIEQFRKDFNYEASEVSQ